MRISVQSALIGFPLLLLLGCQHLNTASETAKHRLDHYYLNQAIGLSTVALEQHLQNATPHFAAGPERVSDTKGEWVIYRYDKILELPLYIPQMEGNRMPAGTASYNIENSCQLIFKLNQQRVESWHTKGLGCG